MDIFELADTLPNGFHDARLNNFAISWVDRVAHLSLDVWIGDANGPKHLLESYRACTLTLTEVEYVVMDPPDPRYPYRAREPVTIDLASAQPSFLQPPASGTPFRLWVGHWNGFIHLTCVAALLTWAGDPYVAVFK